MKAYVKESSFRGRASWQVMEHTSENRRAYLFEKYGRLMFRIVKTTGELEFPPSDYTAYRPAVILTREQWTALHATSIHEISKALETASITQRMEVAKILRILVEPPPFPNEVGLVAK